MSINNQDVHIKEKGLTSAEKTFDENVNMAEA